MITEKKAKRLCLAAGIILLAGGLAWAAVQVFPLQSSVTGSEYIQNHANPTGAFFTPPTLLTYFLGTPNSSGGVITNEQFEVLTTAYTLTSQTGAQQALNATTNGAFTALGLTTYKFECGFNLTAMSATSNSFGFAFGGTATLTSQYWYADAEKGGTSVATPGAEYQTFNVAANTSLTAATTGTTGTAHVYGQVSINAAGTVIPEISLQTAAAAVVGTGSFCRLWPIGTNLVTNTSGWN